MKQAGFTIIEVLIALVVAGVALGSVYSVYQSQQDSYMAQTQVSEMQQNLRIGMLAMEREIRMAGCNPTSALGNFGFMTVECGYAADRVRFTMDVTDDSGTGEPDGDTADDGEDVTFLLVDADGDGDNDLCRHDQRDNDGDGVVDEPDESVVAFNVASVGFAYAFDSDGDRQLESSASGHVIWAVDTDGDNRLDVSLDANDDGTIDENDMGGTPLGTSVNPEDIRAVQIWMLAHSGRSEPKFYDGRTYCVSNKVITPADNVRKHLFKSLVYCRNLMNY